MSNNRQKVVQALRNTLDDFEPKHFFVPALVGDSFGNIAVSGRANFIYVRIYGLLSRKVQALNLTGFTFTEGKLVQVEVIQDKRGVDSYQVVKSALTPPPSSGGGGGTREAVYSIGGGLTVSTGALRLYNKSGAAWTLSNIFLSVGTAPTGANINVTVNKNGASLGNSPSIASGTFTGAAVPTTTSVADGDYLTVDVTQVGAGVAGSDLTVHIIFT